MQRTLQRARSGRVECSQRLQRSGVTLMEALATIVLSAILMTPMIGSLNTARVTWEGFEGSTVRAQTVDSIFRQLGDSFWNAEQVGAIQSNGRYTSLRLRDSTETVQWSHSAATGRLIRVRRSGEDIVANGISSLYLNVYNSRGSLTRSGSDAQSLQVTLSLSDGSRHSRRLWRRPQPNVR